ncbi:T9SS type A sorting domain-containing protein [Aurantibacillus circumpalustris]|uniref:T9SS type A sorting domain-containing protein n=1 Tax=Aurantibacillus circumpalustris TaxID=3036359 RepID=UPI00295BC50E|nr:T9SS type A sorting domain-containing protein [Aurantibacillus circumpalustris]
MKRIFLISLVVFASQALDAQVIFNPSNTGVQGSFIAQSICSVTSTDVYAVGGLYTSSWTPQAYKSINKGVSWSSVAFTGINPAHILYNEICSTGTSMILTAQNSSGSSTGIYSSTDGITWTPSGSGILSNFSGFDLLSVSPSELYAVGTLYLPYLPKIYKSTDDGATWVSLPITGVPPSSQNFLNAFCKIGGTFLLATSNSAGNVGSMFSSLDAINWTYSANGIPNDVQIYDLLTTSTNEVLAVGSVYDPSVLGFITQIYRSTDAGANWSSLNYAGLDPYMTDFKSICQSGNKILVGAQIKYMAGSNSIYSTNVSLLTTGVGAYDTDLFSCFPNPTNGVVTLNSGVELSQITVSDISGRTVLKKNIEPTSFSNNSIVIDLSPYGKGLYFLSLQENGSSKTIKIIVE